MTAPPAPVGRRKLLRRAVGGVILSASATAGAQLGRAEGHSEPERDATPGSTGPRATRIAVEHHDGQTFVTWKDAAAGAAAATYRYSLYRSDRPITEGSLTAATLVEQGIVYNSAKLYGEDFQPKNRLDPSLPTAEIDTGGAPLPQWSGLAVYTAKRPDTAYYAVAVTDTQLRRLDRIVPGVNATTAGLVEQVTPPQPIEIHRAAERAAAPAAISLLQKTGLPLFLQLHASESNGGVARPFGDYYLYFGTERMGYRDGLPGVFSVAPAIWLPGHLLELFPRDAVLKPDGGGALETLWFGYYCVPQWSPDNRPHAYPFTEARLLWLLDWTIRHYRIDRSRVYAGGYSMGGWGTVTFGLRHPELFAALFPQMPRMRQRALANLAPLTATPTLPDGSDYYQRMDMVKLAAEHRGELPFMGWSIGRHDGYASWQDQVDMVHAMQARHRGFAFAWNNGNHSDGTAPMQSIWKYYPPEKFRLDTSYPAFSGSSLDSDIGDGNPDSGDKEGGINLGFDWSTPTDTPATWSTAISNSLATAPMTVDVTPRRTRQFRPPPGTPATWQAASGQSGAATADSGGFVTIRKLQILPGRETRLTISRPA